ncbi:hypothetical protein EVAR_36751_1 [Eumeta japonica]|uniref:Uncharacterized protein n=1 Tax=Eumeta variegata TaxID=151549 RepID=A0A4C1X401_EUMVA|nr:hypothetical protein EVAR_36751_1 [Eumeta japonica]
MRFLHNKCQGYLLKTKCIECYILIEREKVEQVKQSVYLTRVLTNDGKHDGDIEKRVNAGNKVNGALLTIMNSKSVSRQARLAIHNEVLIPTLMYGSESWVWHKKNESRVNAVEMQSLRGVSQKDRCKKQRC